MPEDEEFINQEDALIALMKIECKINGKGCDGPWCSARAAVAKAFGMESELHQRDEDDDEARG